MIFAFLESSCYNSYRRECGGNGSQYYVVETATGKQIEIDIESATNEDLTSTKEKWQSDWTSEFIRDPKLEKYVAKTDAGEIVALGAYREDDHGISVLLRILKRILRVIRQLAQCVNTQVLAE